MMGAADTEMLARQKKIHCFGGLFKYAGSVGNGACRCCFRMWRMSNDKRTIILIAATETIFTRKRQK
jgi:hypothetical protein